MSTDRRNLLRRLADEPRLRWIIYAVLGAVFGLLILFPRPWLARAKIVPQDTSVTASSTTTLLGAIGVNAQGIGSLLTGGRPSNDLYLIIGRSDSVAEEVIKTLNLVGPDRPYRTARAAKLALERKVNIHLLLGGVMEIETKVYDQEEGLRITNAFAAAISQQLAGFGRQIIVNKRRLVRGRFQDAVQRVSAAEAQLNAFRRRFNLPDPDAQFGARLSARTTLEAQLRAKQLEYQTQSRFRGPESQELEELRSDIAGLQQQIRSASVPSAAFGTPNLAGLTALQMRYLSLYRNLRFQQSIYDVYQRSAEQVAVEELASGSASYIQVIDPANIDPTRQFNVWAIALFAGVLLVALFTEVYGPATGLFQRRGLTRSPETLEPAE